jgi:class 3 adenylate cyclase
MSTHDARCSCACVRNGHGKRSAASNDSVIVPELPTGALTLLFTDIEGSIRRCEEHPAAMQGALAEHDRILRSAIESNGGFVFKTGGDAVAAAAALREIATRLMSRIGPVMRVKCVAALWANSPQAVN